MQFHLDGQHILPLLPVGATLLLYHITHVAFNPSLSGLISESKLAMLFASIHMSFPNSFPYLFFSCISEMIPFLKILQLMQNET